MKKNLVLFLMVALVCFMSFSVYAATDLTDIEGHWAQKGIERWSNEEVVNGYEDDSYRPDNNVTRAEFIAMVIRVFEPTKTADISNYSDMDKEAWYYDAISKAVAMGLINGYDDDTIRPSDNITRQEAMVILNRALQLTSSEDSSVEKFKDAEKIADWAKGAILAFTERGYVNGYEDGSLNPTGSITRAEVAQILDKTVGLIAKEPGEYDMTGIEGAVIVKSEGVELKNTDSAEIEKIVVTNEDAKSTLKTDASTEVAEDLIVVVDEMEPINTEKEPAETNPENTEKEPEVTDPEKTENEDKKPSGGSSSSGGGGGSSSKVTTSKIVLTTDGEDYKVTRTGSVVDGGKLTVIVDGTTVLDKYTVKSSSFETNMKTVIGALDTDKVVNTISSAKYNELPGIREWGMNTVMAMEQSKIDVAFKAAVLGNNNKALVSVVYNALKDSGMTSDEIKEIAVSVLPNTFSYKDGITALNKI